MSHSPATTAPLKPAPTSRFHASGGPSLGHVASRPVSVERPSRVGPRNCGQSPLDAGAVTGEVRTRQSRPWTLYAMMISKAKRLRGAEILVRRQDHITGNGQRTEIGCPRRLASSLARLIIKPDWGIL